ncbi:hypothetical protein BCR35DRAFT_67175 [Leucosporidium creatinivorum]|uniref:Uncharacterized protein n=1 Tax=Leucosporidium creatinivorum TaxID=106004 RepID=A0A1Y2G4K4_9BASI|nr:hypothetical protein BCR35DRAFT_67175 [Leucosporidium creatinivorum]
MILLLVTLLRCADSTELEPHRSRRRAGKAESERRRAGRDERGGVSPRSLAPRPAELAAWRRGSPPVKVNKSALVL